MKIAIINRAVVGSGKSTMAKAIADLVGICTIHSTDEYFMVKGEYKFNPAKLGEYHGKNWKAFANDCEEGIDVVICDNTNIFTDHCKPYVDIAKENGYRVIQLFFEPDTLEAHLARNAHNVPKDSIERMIKGLQANRGSIGEDYAWVIQPHEFKEELLRIPQEVYALAKL